MPRLLLGPPAPPKETCYQPPTSIPTSHPHVLTPGRLPCLLQPPAGRAEPALPPQGAHHRPGGLLAADPRGLALPLPSLGVTPSGLSGAGTSSPRLGLRGATSDADSQEGSGFGCLRDLWCQGSPGVSLVEKLRPWMMRRRPLTGSHKRGRLEQANLVESLMLCAELDEPMSQDPSISDLPGGEGGNPGGALPCQAWAGGGGGGRRAEWEGRGQRESAVTYICPGATGHRQSIQSLRQQLDAGRRERPGGRRPAVHPGQWALHIWLPTGAGAEKERLGSRRPSLLRKGKQGAGTPGPPGRYIPSDGWGRLEDGATASLQRRFRPRLGLSRRCSAGNADQLKHSEQLSRIRTSGLELSTS